MSWRCRGDVAEMPGDVVEMPRRCRGDVAEMRGDVRSPGISLFHRWGEAGRRYVPWNIALCSMEHSASFPPPSCAK